MSKTRVCISYSHRDEDLRAKLVTHLAALQREGLIQTWQDRDIAPGQEWRAAIDEQFESSEIILLLVSADFIASEFCWSKEMKRAMELHEAGKTRVIPIILRPCDWHAAPFSKLQALPKNAQPITSWSSKDEAFADVARGIRQVVKSLSPAVES